MTRLAIANEKGRVASQSLRKSGLWRPVMNVEQDTFLIYILSQSLRKSGLWRRKDIVIYFTTVDTRGRNPFVNQVFGVNDKTIRYMVRGL